MQATMRSVLSPEALYLGDNGRCFCGRHAGMTASATGRDLSGCAVIELSAKEIADAKQEFGVVLACETCGRLA